MQNGKKIVCGKIPPTVCSALTLPACHTGAMLMRSARWYRAQQIQPLAEPAQDAAHACTEAAGIIEIYICQCKENEADRQPEQILRELLAPELERSTSPEACFGRCPARLSSALPLQLMTGNKGMGEG